MRNATSAACTVMKQHYWGKGKTAGEVEAADGRSDVKTDQTERVRRPHQSSVRSKHSSLAPRSCVSYSYPVPHEALAG